ncbi:hypothetical protein HHI36_022344 [Cryptolaemus montrouzieri]|uniref:Uncharacterized protein n=1 Tax=Cryptolaemus montrouzieri TaxID=559131 RepID=A0ABD2MZN8_9CUCU
MFSRSQILVELAVNQRRDSSSESELDSESSEEFLSDIKVSESDTEDDIPEHVEELEESDAAGGYSINSSMNCKLPNTDANWIEIEASEELFPLTCSTNQDREHSS